VSWPNKRLVQRLRVGLRQFNSVRQEDADLLIFQRRRLDGLLEPGLSGALRRAFRAGKVCRFSKPLEWSACYVCRRADPRPGELDRRSCQLRWFRGDRAVHELSRVARGCLESCKRSQTGIDQKRELVVNAEAGKALWVHGVSARESGTPAGT